MQEARETRCSGSEITISSRREMRVSGVEEVISFDELGARLRCSDGELSVEGSELHVDVLDTEKGTVTMKGRIDGIYYTDVTERKRRLFGGAGR